MPRIGYCLLATLLALPAAVHGQEMLPMPTACGSVSCVNQIASECKMVEKTYPMGHLLHAVGGCPACPALLIKSVTQCIAPESWQGHGGEGTIDFCPVRVCLIVNQTPEVQKQVGALMTVVNQLASAYSGPVGVVPVGMPVPPPQVAPAPAPYPPERLTHSAEPKQHFRFVLDGVRIRTDEKATVIIKHVELEYAGDGIDTDVAKCAIKLGGSEKKPEKSEGAAAAVGSSIGAVTGGLTGNAVETKEAVKAEEKSEKFETKKVDEEEDQED